MASLFDGVERPKAVILATARSAVERFPFDFDLRVREKFMRRELNR